MNATEVVDQLLGSENQRLVEASVHLPPRGTKWLAVFTGPEPGKQIWRSTGLTNREAALMVAQKWEQEARDERKRITNKHLKKRSSRVRQEIAGLMTQKEVAAVLGMSERGVREVERRAFAKLRRDASLQRLWNQY